MINQQLLDYISQQRSAGVSDTELKNRLVESGWNETDVNLALGKGNIEEKKPQTGNISLYDLSTPGVNEIGVSGNKTQNPPVVATSKAESGHEKQKGQNMWKLVLVMVIILAIAGGGLLIFINTRRMISPLATPAADNNQESGNLSSQQGQATGETVSGIYENATQGFSLMPPQGWRIDNSGTYGTLVVFTNPTADIEGENKFTANMNVVAEDTNQTLDQYIEASKDLLTQNFTNHVLVSERKVEVTGGSGAILESTFDQGIFKLHNLQLVYMAKGKVYVTTAVSLDSNWGNYKQMFEDTAASFQVK